MKPETPDAFTPISPNPYIVGNPVRDRAMFFGREAEFDLVKKRFVESRAAGGLLIFCGERRSGKTSILFQIDQGRLGPGFVPVLIDMQSMAVESEADFLVKVGGLILERMGSKPEPRLQSLADSKQPVAAFLELVQASLGEQPERKLILLFDEYELFENKIKDGVISEEALHALAHLTENQSVFLVFTGSLSLEERHQDYWKVFLGRSTFKKISFLERRDALSLITDPVGGRVHYEDGVVESIFRLSAGQPFYTQAVCQSIVDQLNEHHSDRATSDILQLVVEGIVAQPFPQMTFRWEELEKNEKLVLALLAETLPDSRSSVSAKDLCQTLTRGRYPLRLDDRSIAATLEGLFRKEILLLFEAGQGRAYAFRVDLWRHWVRRMHTVWQVMRELGMEIRPDEKRRRVVRRVVGMSIVMVAALAVAWFGRDWFRRKPLEAAATTGRLSIQTNLPDASIHIDGKRRGTGGFASSSFPQGPHEVLISRPGYESASFAVNIPVGAGLDTMLNLAALPGGFFVSTVPSGADVFVNESFIGKSPVEAKNLRPNESYAVRVTLAGYSSPTRMVTTRPDSVIQISFSLSAVQAALIVRSDPDGATVFVDKVAAGKTTTQPIQLAPGKHHIRVEHPGFVAKDTTLNVDALADIMLRLKTQPLGHLQIKGDGKVFATMYVNDVQVQKSHTRWPGGSYKEGNYRVTVVFDDSSRPDTSFVVPVQSGCETILNFVTGTHDVQCGSDGDQ